MTVFSCPRISQDSTLEPKSKYESLTFLKIQTPLLQRQRPYETTTYLGIILQFKLETLRATTTKKGASNIFFLLKLTINFKGFSSSKQLTLKTCEYNSRNRCQINSSQKMLPQVSPEKDINQELSILQMNNEHMLILEMVLKVFSFLIHHTPQM